MSSVVPCLEYCSDEKSSQAMLMELSPLSNNTQPSPKDSGVDVSSPSRRDEDNIFGSPQIPQTLSSKGGFVRNVISSKSSTGMFEASDMTTVGLSTNMKITSSTSSLSMCSLEVSSRKLEGKEYSKTSKFYSRDRKKHFNIGEFQAKEFRKIIMSDPKDKRKKYPSLTKSSATTGAKCPSGHSLVPGTISRKTPDDLNKNYAVIPIEEKKVGIVIKVTKPFPDTKKRKISVDKLDSPPKKNSVSKDGSLNSLKSAKVDDVDRSSNMSPTMPELHKETPFVIEKFLDENRRATRSQLNNTTHSIQSFQSDRRSNLRSGSKASPKYSKMGNHEDASCPLPPVITAIEPQEESPTLSHLPKKITCKLAGSVISSKTLTSDHFAESKSCSWSRKAKNKKSSSKEPQEYLQVKSISGLKIKLAKPGIQTSGIVLDEHSNAPKLSENSSKDNLQNMVIPAQETGSSFSCTPPQNLCKIVSSYNGNGSSPIMSSFPLCSSVSSHCSKPVFLENAGSLMIGERYSNSFQVSPGFDGFHLENLDGKVKFTQEKEVVMPDGKKKKLKLKMFVPSPISLPPICEGDTINTNAVDELSRLYGNPADVVTTLCSQESVPLHGSHGDQNHCKTSMSQNSFSVPDERNINSQVTCSLSISHWPSPRVVLSQCTSQNPIQFIEGNDTYFDPGNMIKLPGPLGSLSSISPLQKSHKSKNHQHGIFPSTPENAVFHYGTVSHLCGDNATQLSFDGASKCNSTPMCKSPVASGVSGVNKTLETSYPLINSHCAVMLPANNMKPEIPSEDLFSSVCICSATKQLKECFDPPEGLSGNSVSVKTGAEESNDYGDMPTLEKNDISNQSGNFKAVDPVTEKLESSRCTIIEKENFLEKTTKKFKFDGLELEYCVENVPVEESFATRCLRKRNKDEKEVKEKFERHEKPKPKRKRGVSRTSTKKLKAFTISHHSEAASQDIQINQSSHIEEPVSSVVLSNTNNKLDNMAFSSSLLNQSFNFSTPPPSDASCPLGDLSASSSEDPRFAPGSSTACSKSFCINEPVCSGSVIPSSFSCSMVSTPSSVTTISSSSAAFCISSSSPLPWSQILSASTKSSESLNPLCRSPYECSRSLNLPVISSHLSPLSSVCMTPLSAEINLHGQNNVVAPVLGSPDSVTTSPSPPSPPPPPPKFVRSFKEVEPSSVVTTSLSPIELVTSTISSSSQSHLEAIPERSLLSAKLDATQRQSDNTNLFVTSSLFSFGPETIPFGSTESHANNHLFAPPLITMCNGRDKSALFEEKSMRLHRISQRLQANSAISLKNSNAQDADCHVLHPVLGKSPTKSHLQESLTIVDKEEIKVKEEELNEKTLDENLKKYYNNNDEEIAKYISDQVQLVKLRNKAYRLFCCLFPEVQMPLRLSPDSEAVDQLLESVVFMLEEKNKAKECKSDEMNLLESAQEGPNVCLSSILSEFKTENQLDSHVILCCKPHSCLLQLQGLVRQFLCLVLPHLNACLSSDASLSVMDKIIDRVVLANCAFIGLGCTNGFSPSAQTSEDGQFVSSKSEDFVVT